MPGFSLRNPHLVIVAALLVVILGVMSFERMPVDVFPRLYIKAAVVAIFYPGLRRPPRGAAPAAAQKPRAPL